MIMAPCCNCFPLPLQPMLMLQCRWTGWLYCRRSTTARDPRRTHRRRTVSGVLSGRVNGLLPTISTLRNGCQGGNRLGENISALIKDV